MQEKNNGLIDFMDALKMVVEQTNPTAKTISVTLFEAVGMILAKDIVCRKPLPAFDNSAMDGYGVKVCDAGKRVKIVGAVFAGDDINGVEIKEGECVKIMTGAPVPLSVEAVVPFENALGVEEDGVSLPQNIRNGLNIRKKGEESNLGDILLQKGDRLTPAAIGTLASQGVFVVKVSARPRVAVVSSGDEIAEPWEGAKEHQIYNSNASMLMALCLERGCEPHYVKLVGDGYEATLETIRSLKGYDLVLTTGGISMGEADFVGKAFLECGLKPIFKKIALKPGKPTMFGYLGDTVVLALPGNPISAIANFYIFGSVAIARLSGAKACNIGYVEATNKSGFNIKASRANLILGYLKNGEFEVFENNSYGSGMLRPMVESNAFIMTSEGVEQMDAGEKVKAVMLGSHLVEEFCDFMSAK